jgi:hypothetical protein
MKNIYVYHGSSVRKKTTCAKNEHLYVVVRRDITTNYVFYGAIVEENF